MLEAPQLSKDSYFVTGNFFENLFAPFILRFFYPKANYGLLESRQYQPPQIGLLDSLLLAEQNYETTIYKAKAQELRTKPSQPR